MNGSIDIKIKKIKLNSSCKIKHQLTINLNLI